MESHGSTGAAELVETHPNWAFGIAAAARGISLIVSGIHERIGLAAKANW
jgi:hypothetical protein